MFITKFNERSRISPSGEIKLFLPKGRFARGHPGNKKRLGGLSKKKLALWRTHEDSYSAELNGIEGGSLVCDTASHCPRPK